MTMIEALKTVFLELPGMTEGIWDEMQDRVPSRLTPADRGRVIPPDQEERVMQMFRDRLGVLQHLVSLLTHPQEESVLEAEKSDDVINAAQYATLFTKSVTLFIEAEHRMPTEEEIACLRGQIVRYMLASVPGEIIAVLANPIRPGHVVFMTCLLSL